ncbi:LamG-like jellyroll fold domain-containing protein [Flavobacterium aciduliphilum]|uniref:Putative secreted protein (Por secretion system target) n=1 Tax=Flavobacterium aciduliphilum TaxID=1101402 RepID=A0A328YPQ6_9FLAO|nr:LamG-like jellyroll fold domain-containing protein [Flavobacterium aciduliphilum]RAR74142.1 putative secreted protein (Por secretion system target) [Flavobacterium aciduliphilum]
MNNKKLLLLILGIGLFSQMIFSQVPSYVPTNGLVGYWPFSGNANDQSGNGNNGTVNGATLTIDRFGNSNNAYEFNMNYIKVNNSSLYNLSDNLSINVWYKISDSMGSITLNTVFVSKHQSSSLNSSYSLYNENNCGPTVYQTDVDGNINYIRNSAFCDTSSWHMLTLSFNKPNMIMYLDGIYYSTITANSIKQTILPLVFGGTNNSSNPDDIVGRMKGKLDDIGIWNRALTQQEITNLYYSENTCQSLVINTGVLSFNPPTYNNTITIYPNPANDHITIDCGNLSNVSGWTIKIVNTLGQEVFGGAMNTQQYVVPLNSWGGQGVYFVKVYDASNNLLNIKKIILQ